MKLACIGDLHLSERSPRYPHALAMLEWAVADARAAGADAIALLGDIFEGHPTGAEHAALLSILHPDLAILGNHEAHTALAFWPRLGILTAWEREAVLATPEVKVLAIPYPRRGRPPFDELGGESIAETMQRAADRVAQIIAAHRDHRPLIVLGHFTIEGMTAGASEFELHTATEVVVPRAAFDGCALTAVGHVHRRQEVTERIIGIGSLIRHSFAERHDPKSYTMVTVERGTVTYEHRDVPARELWQFECEWGASGWVKELARG